MRRGDSYARALQCLQGGLEDLKADIENGEILTGEKLKQRLDSMHVKMHGQDCSCAMKGTFILGNLIARFLKYFSIY